MAYYTFGQALGNDRDGNMYSFDIGNQMVVYKLPSLQTNTVADVMNNLAGENYMTDYQKYLSERRSQKISYLFNKGYDIYKLKRIDFKRKETRDLEKYGLM